MAIKLFAKRSKKRSPKIEIIPMVDVMFLLLVFYILSSLALHGHHAIPVNLPKAASSEGGESSVDLTITIDQNGQYFIGQERVDSDKLSGAIRAFAAGHGGLEELAKHGITINADLSTSHKNVVFAMDQMRLLGLNNFLISTTGETTSKP